MSAIAELKAIANLDSKGFEAGAGKVRSATGTMVSGLGRIAGAVGAAFSIAAVIGFAKTVTNEATAVKRLADSVGIASGMIDELGDKAEETGASADGFRQKIVKLSDSQEEAVKGNKDATESFKRLGVTMSDLVSLSPDKLLEKVARGAQSDATAISDLNNVMGKGAAGEYYAVLQKISRDGLPAVSGATTETINKLAVVESKFAKLWNLAKETAMGNIVKTAEMIGVDLSTPGASEFDQQNRAIVKARGLEQERARIRTEALDKIHLKETKQVKDIEDSKAKALDHITIDSPKVADAMAKIGGMIGGGMRSNGLAERSLKELEVIAEYTKDMAKAQEETTKAIAELE